MVSAGFNHLNEGSSLNLIEWWYIGIGLGIVVLASELRCLFYIINSSYWHSGFYMPFAEDQKADQD